MNPVRVFALLAILTCVVTGCRHKVVPAPAPVVTTPPLPPSSMTHEQSLPPVPQPGQPRVGPPGSDQQQVEEKPAPVPKRPHHPKKHTASGDVSTASNSTTPSPAPAATTGSSATGPTTQPQQAAVPEPSLGQLSAGSGADSHERAAMTDEIHAQELRLGAIRHPLSSESEAITLQVKVFLAKARQAALENDLDGARTLTMKAKVLLDELSNS